MFGLPFSERAISCWNGKSSEISKNSLIDATAFCQYSESQRRNGASLLRHACSEHTPCASVEPRVTSEHTIDSQRTNPSLRGLLLSLR